MNAIQFNKDFLTNRIQRICVKATKLDWLNIKHGVPHGKIPQPLFFVLYVHDITNYCTSNTEICQYADDTLISASDRYRSTGSEAAQTQIQCLCSYIERINCN